MVASARKSRQWQGVFSDSSFFPRENHIGYIRDRILIAKQDALKKLLPREQRFSALEQRMARLFDERLAILINDDIDGHIDFHHLWRIAGYSTRYVFDAKCQNIWYHCVGKLGFEAKSRGWYRFSNVGFSPGRRARVSPRGLFVEFNIIKQSIDIYADDIDDCLEGPVFGSWRILVKDIPHWGERGMARMRAF